MFEIDRTKFIIACVVILIIWGSLWALWYMKADEVTKDPCSICSKRMGELVRCTTGQSNEYIKDYYPNGSITYDYPRDFYNLTFP